MLVSNLDEKAQIVNCLGFFLYSKKGRMKEGKPSLLTGTHLA